MSSVSNARPNNTRLLSEIPLSMVLSAFGYGVALSQTAVALFPVIALEWWFYVLLLVGAGTGVLMPLIRETQGANVGRLMIGFLWLLTPSILGSIGAILHGGWTPDDLLVRGVLPGVLVFGAFVMASSLGDACLLLVPLGDDERDTQMEVEARRSAEGIRQFLSTSFKGWVLLALIGSGLIDSVVSMQGRTLPTLGTAFGTAVGLGAALLTLHLAYLHHRHCFLASKEDDQVIAVNRLRWQGALPLIGSVTVLALLFPANVSPIARQGLGGFFVWLTDRVAPLFVPGRRPAASSSNGGFMDRLVQGVLSRLGADGDGTEAAVSTISLVLSALLMIVIVGATAFALWRLIKLMQLRGGGEDHGGARYKERGLLVELIVWLWQQLRGLFRAVSNWADALVQSEGSEGERRRGRRGRKGRAEDVSDRSPAARIRALFARWLHQMSHLGYPRHKDETPYEYARRVTELRPDAREELGQTADIYVKARYSPQQEATVLERAYQALRASVSQALQAIRRRNADPQ